LSGAPNCYAVRRVNPFQGVVEIVEIDAARALSIDGRHWQIQVEAARPEHTWGRGEPTNTVKQFFRFGSWHPEQGLSRVTVNPILDIGAMLAASERMIAVLQAVQSRLPFPFADNFEHWLLDDQGQPLALLATTVEQRFTAEICADSWSATAPRSPDFTAASLTAQGIPASDAHGNRHHADTLERLIRDAAGPVPRRCWYQRQADGSATPLDADCHALPATAFPELPLRTAWPDAAGTALVEDYLDWLAPLLLTLDTLGEATRRDLEQAARHQALQMTDHHPLYPQVLQPDVLDTARVEARLRRAAS
jgi:hypothetical protein